MTHDGVVFDMDGVLVERSPSWVFDDAADDALAAARIDSPTADDYRAVRNLPDDCETVAARFEERHGIDFETVWATREAFVSAKQLVAVQRGEKAVYDDAVEAVGQLPVEAAVVSNNQHRTVDKLLSRFGFATHLRDWRGLRPTLPDVGRRKPDPAHLNEVLETLDCENPVYVGDRVSDVETAIAAGIDAAFVRRPFNESVTHETPPVYELDSLLDVLELTG